MKEFLSQNKIFFEEKSLNEEKWLEELGETYGVYSAPTVIVDGTLIEGANIAAIARAAGVPY